MYPYYLNKNPSGFNVPMSHIYSNNYNNLNNRNLHMNNNTAQNENKSNSKEKFDDNVNENRSNSKEHERKDFFEIFGIKLYFDDILILCLLYVLYKEEVHDEMLFFALVLLLIS